MKSIIALTFDRCKKEKRPALLTYTVAGDNSKKNSLEINQSIEKMIVKNPYQWIWTHNRWK